MATRRTLPADGSSACASQVASRAISSAVGALDMRPFRRALGAPPRELKNGRANDRRLCLRAYSLHHDRRARRSLSLSLPDVPARDWIGVNCLRYVSTREHNLGERTRLVRELADRT